ncbi:MAG: polysaccharide deacetylase [Lachnospiraceae bacterium]|nr:polysaccharide deacetylase [Lachnospiraceae bacterium]
MDKDMETLDQRLKAIQKERELEARRKRVNIIKYIIVTVPCVIAVIPVIISLSLMSRVSAMEDKVTAIKALRGENTILFEDNSGINGIDNITDYITTSANAEQEDYVKKGKRVYLTFDDGPSIYTDEILDILAEEEVKACFFVIGNTDSTGTSSESVINSYKRIVKDGHSIGIHSYSHDYSKIYDSLKDFKKDVNTMSDLIFVNTGVRTHLYRFPGGSGNTVSELPIEKFAKWLTSEGYVYYDWNAFTGDAVAQTLPADTLCSNALTYIEQNAAAKRDTILLMHDHSVKHNMVEALPKLIKELKKKGYVMTKPLDETVPPVQQIANGD